MKYIIRAKFPEYNEFITIPSKIKSLIEKHDDESFDFVVGDLEIVKQKKPAKEIEKWTNQKRINTKKCIGDKYLLKTKTALYEVEIVDEGFCKIKEKSEKTNEVLTFTQFLKLED
jgi:hypothetical protein